MLQRTPALGQGPWLGATGVLIDRAKATPSIAAVACASLTPAAHPAHPSKHSLSRRSSLHPPRGLMAGGFGSVRTGPGGYHQYAVHSASQYKCTFVTLHGLVESAAVGSISGVPHVQMGETGCWVRVARGATLIGIGAQKSLVTTRLQLTWQSNPGTGQPGGSH